MLTWTVTFSCNARCSMCDSWKKAPDQELSIADAERIFSQIPRLDAVRLTGGEPFVRKDFAELAEVATRILDPFYLHVTTNGFLTGPILKFLESRNPARPLHLLISLDGAPDDHNRIRGRENAFGRAWETLSQVAMHRKAWNVQPMVNQTIVDESGIDGYGWLHERLSALGIQHQVVMGYQESATYSVKKAQDLAPDHPGEFRSLLEIGPERLGAFFGQLEQDLGALSPANRLAKKYYLDGIRNRMERKVGKPNPPCVALGAHLRIFPNGDVPVCQFNSRILGNLRNQSFSEVWDGPDAGRWRAWVKACPGCWAECEVLPNALYSGDMVSYIMRRRLTRPAECGVMRNLA